ncbi:MAG: aspartate-semialdehyde dehydrogenase [Bacteroidales bacterium]|nr:aspartate-semialdehyde dehydrogenase [Bacteroidales bacterium]
MKVAVVGASGLVGQTIIQLLEDRNFPVSELILAASKKSIGKKISFKNKYIEINSVENALLQKPEIALFAAGGKVSLAWAEKFVAENSCVIDNSSAFRLQNNVKLIVPEVNATELNKEPQIIANPNCSTIQLVAVLSPLHKIYGLKRVIVSTYQAVSGSGSKGLQQLEDEKDGISNNLAYPHQIYKNCLPHAGSFLENGYTDEEMKLVDESRKILNLPNLAISGTVVRVPVDIGHSESVNIEFENKPDISEIFEVLRNTPNIIVKDSPKDNLYPMPINATNKDQVFVGRIREDLSNENAINLWIVADNLRKGAATNAVQIAEYFFSL